jgi:hypothetical protein
MAAKMNKSDIPRDKFDLYEKLIATRPDIERKGAKVPYTSLNGHMFTFLSANGTLAIRLNEGDRSDFLEKYNTRLMESYGVVMKEYVSVPDSLLAKTDELKGYLDMSHAYIATLKPKPTTKKPSK